MQNKKTLADKLLTDPVPAVIQEVFNLLGWTQAQAAVNLGVTPGTVSRWLTDNESAYRTPSRAAITLLIRCLEDA